MLVLIRRVGESIAIGEDVTVTVLGMRGGQVRIGVGAPREIGVHRQEVFDRIRRERSIRSLGATRKKPSGVGA
jgi:carbon storage regulator